MVQLTGILDYLFPFEPSWGLRKFGLYIAPWIYLIGVFVVAVMLFRSKERPLSMMFFIVPSAITSLIVALDIVNEYLVYLGETIFMRLTIFFVVIGPLFLLLFLISSLSGIIETIVRKLSIRSLIITFLALFCSCCFYIYLFIYVFLVFF